MREVVNIHVGQCGNQIASAFWNLLLLEHENTPDDDPTLSSFFYYLPNPKYSAKGPSHVMKARALLIDMECGVLQETMRSSLGSLFDETQFIMDVSGAGNNYAHGYYGYGQQYHGHLLEGIRHNVEKCESLQAFFLTHSLGGGTGSGLGSYILTLLADEYPKITKIATSVYPSEENDVITSPYNTILATRELIKSADCVFPLSNSSLFAFHQLESPPKTDKSNTISTTATTQLDVMVSTKSGKGNSGSKKRKERGFDEINLIAARMLCNLTAPSRFHGEMNVDLNEIYTNLIPFPNLHFLTTALNLRYPNITNQQRLRNDHSRNALQRAFLDIISHKGQLSGLSNLPGLGSIQHSCITASAFLARGKVILSDFIHCVNMAQRSMRFPIWNQDACKIGLCGTASPGEEMGVLGIYNSTAIVHPLSRELSNFQRLFRAKAMLHHYTEYLEEGTVRDAEYEVSQLISDYEAIDKNQFPRTAGTAHSQADSQGNSDPFFGLFPAF